jgi:phage baseplate assembly protein W
MSEYSPKLPLSMGKGVTYDMLQTLKGVIQQNFKMLVLTIPGERMMIPEFGAGLYRFFFEPMSEKTFFEVKQEIENQVQTFMPFLKINSIDFITSKEDTQLPDNQLYVSISYSAPSINLTDNIQLVVNNYEF